MTTNTNNPRIVRAIQYAVARWNFRGLVRLTWATHRQFLGTGMRVLRYRDRFDIVCDCDSHYAVMTCFGFNHRSIDRLISRLINRMTDEVVFFDIGANIGFVTLLACSVQNKNVVAHCFEPNPEAYQHLVENINHNRFPATPNQSAIGSKIGNVSLYLGDKSSNSTLINGGLNYVNHQGTENVEVNTLDNYCLEHNISPSIVKIDVEGFEPYVLEGGERVLRSAKPYLIIEFDSKALCAGCNDAEYLLKQLRQAGYQPYFIDVGWIKKTGNSH